MSAERTEFEAALKIYSAEVFYGPDEDDAYAAVLAIFDRIVGERDERAKAATERDNRCIELAAERDAALDARDRGHMGKSPIGRKALAVIDTLRAERDAAVDKLSRLLEDIANGTEAIPSLRAEVAEHDAIWKRISEMLLREHLLAGSTEGSIQRLVTYHVNHEAEVAVLTAERDGLRQKLADSADALALMFHRSPYCPKGFAIPSDCVPDCDWQPVHRWFMGRASSPLHDENAALTADNDRLRAALDRALGGHRMRSTIDGAPLPKCGCAVCVDFRTALAPREAP